MRQLLTILCLVLISLTAFGLRCWNLREVFVEGHVYFVDGDCYARMTRVARIAEGRTGWSIGHHDFENHPAGIQSHTTMPMDALILALKAAIVPILHVLDPSGTSTIHSQALDLAAALSGPLLGTAACIACVLVLLGLPGIRRWHAVSAGILLTLSPIAVQGTVLGRPDHQSLLILLLVLALGSEFHLLTAPTLRWSTLAGLSWGLALWTSFYEPLILFLLATVAALSLQPAQLRSRERHVAWGSTAFIVLMSILIDGWRVTWPDPVTMEFFPRWGSTIFELRPGWAFPQVFWQWLGWSVALVPVALIWRWSRDLITRFTVLLLLTSLALTAWQIRWGYFLVITHAIGLALAIAQMPRPKLAAGLYLVCLWPIASEWDRQLFPSEAEQRRRYAAQREQVELRTIAELYRSPQIQPFLAPWWLSPALAYWSGQPGVAGTSHESLPGIIDSCRVYLAEDFGKAQPVLEARGVQWIVADEPERIVPNACAILGTTAPGHCLAEDLIKPALPPPFTLAMVPDHRLSRASMTQTFHVWRVRPSRSAANSIEQ